MMQMTILYESGLPDSQEFFDLFETTGWNQAKPIQQDQIYTAISHSWYTVSAYKDDRLVGFGRVISDGIYHALIVEMIVHPKFQRQEIGSQILCKLVQRCREAGIQQIQLFCARGKSGFYQKHGFKERPVDAPGMEL